MSELPAALPPSDPLAALNTAFRDAYAARRDAVLAEMGPVIAQIDDLLILRMRGERHEGPARTRRYHEFKSLAHLPLALYALLSGPRGALDEATRERLTTLRRLVTDTEASLAQRAFSSEERTRQQRLLGAAREQIDQVLSSGSVSAGALAAYVRAQAPDLLRNAEDAARDQLETMHATVEAWKQRMTPEERDQLRAVVAVSHMSRPGNVAVQYFSVTLGERWEGRFDQEGLNPGKRVLAAETTFDEEASFTLLATHVLDANVGTRFFGEETRLSRDALADATERLLAKMFHQEPAPPSPPTSA
ncbi:hypothetical protein D187_002748 [Cystobacter fuscus DSM 2262]|uniref:Uncharacterized protein n=1 Tax=Cystobacter fuscus (strain ATCC 25194 / DSM 2262 / NBRC 100088 / M29) TaxID=1242864 RepID=S9PBF3_CYSF2|nr:hypothetical protein [Cystobacter fuscus]EPX59587.1 hypothetical protein D187_002748 [Cystobacter fuscus DSM 2262]